MGLPGLNQYNISKDKCMTDLMLKDTKNDAGEAWTHNHSTTEPLKFSISSISI